METQRHLHATRKNCPAVVGLTGGIASGKSTVLVWLKQQGCAILDSDAIARDVVMPGEPAWHQIVSAFGTEILSDGTHIDRKVLAQRIFTDASQRKLLESIVHPQIIAKLRQGSNTKRMRSPAFPPMILDIPLLFESGLTDIADQNWLVWVPREIQLQRLMIRDRLSVEDAELRLAAQLPIDDKQALADVVIDNSGTWKDTEALLRRLWKTLSNDEIKT